MLIVETIAKIRRLHFTEGTVRYLGVDLEDALTLSEGIDL